MRRRMFVALMVVAATTMARPSPAEAVDVIVGVKSEAISKMVASVRRSGVKIYDLNLQIYVSDRPDVMPGEDGQTASWQGKYPSLPRGVGPWSRYRYWYFVPVVPGGVPNLIDSLAFVNDSGNGARVFDGKIVRIDTALFPEGMHTLDFRLMHRNRNELRLLHAFRFASHPREQAADDLTFALRDPTEWVKGQLVAGTGGIVKCWEEAHEYLQKALVSAYLERFHEAWIFYPDIVPSTSWFKRYEAYRKGEAERCQREEEGKGLAEEIRQLREELDILRGHMAEKSDNEHSEHEEAKTDEAGKNDHDGLVACRFKVANWEEAVRIEIIDTSGLVVEDRRVIEDGKIEIRVPRGEYCWRVIRIASGERYKPRRLYFDKINFCVWRG